MSKCCLNDVPADPRDICVKDTCSNMAATDEVEYYRLYKNRPLYFHFYIAPFVLIYLVWLYAWFMVYGVSDYFEIGAIIGVIILLCQILFWLFSMWSVHIRCFLTCNKVSSNFCSRFYEFESDNLEFGTIVCIFVNVQCI